MIFFKYFIIHFPIFFRDIFSTNVKYFHHSFIFVISFLYFIIIKESHLNSLLGYRSSNLKRNSVVIAPMVMRVLALIQGDDIDLDSDVRQSSKILPSPLTIPHWWSSTRCRTGLVSVNRSYKQKTAESPWLWSFNSKLEIQATLPICRKFKVKHIFKKMNEKTKRKNIVSKLYIAALLKDTSKELLQIYLLSNHCSSFKVIKCHIIVYR